jgi:hypothetical protein
MQKQIDGEQIQKVELGQVAPRTNPQTKKSPEQLGPPVLRLA